MQARPHTIFPALSFLQLNLQLLCLEFSTAFTSQILVPKVVICVQEKSGPCLFSGCGNPFVWHKLIKVWQKRWGTLGRSLPVGKVGRWLVEIFPQQGDLEEGDLVAGTQYYRKDLQAENSMCFVPLNHTCIITLSEKVGEKDNWSDRIKILYESKQEPQQYNMWFWWMLQNYHDLKVRVTLRHLEEFTITK